MIPMSARIALVLLALASVSGVASAAMNYGMQPPPHVAGLPQYQINSGKNVEFDSGTFNIGPGKQTGEAEGQVWQRVYRLQQGAKSEGGQAAGKFTDLLRSLGSANVVEMNYRDAAKSMYGSTGSRVVFGSFAKDNKEIRVEMQVNGGASEYTLTILEPSEMRQDAKAAPPPSGKPLSGDLAKQPPPYVSGLPQYQISSGRNIEFDAFTFNTGKQLVEELEGQVWQRVYRLDSALPQNPSSLQVARNYANLLRSLGSANVVEMHYSDAARRMYGSTGSRVVSGSFIKDNRELRVEMQVQGGAGEYTLTILEPSEMRQDVGEAPSPRAARSEPAPVQENVKEKHATPPPVKGKQAKSPAKGKK